MTLNLKWREFVKLMKLPPFPWHESVVKFTVGRIYCTVNWGKIRGGEGWVEAELQGYLHSIMLHTWLYSGAWREQRTPWRQGGKLQYRQDVPAPACTSSRLPWLHPEPPNLSLSLYIHRKFAFHVNPVSLFILTTLFTFYSPKLSVMEPIELMLLNK